MVALNTQPNLEGNEPLQHVHIEEHGKAHEPWHFRLLWISIAAVITCLVAVALGAAISPNNDTGSGRVFEIRQWVSAAAPFAALTLLDDQTEHIPLVVGQLGYVLKPTNSDETAIQGEIICSSHHHGVGSFELRFDATNRVALLLRFKDGTRRRLELEATR